MTRYKISLMILTAIVLMSTACRQKPLTFVVLSDTHLNGESRRVEVLDSMALDINTLAATGNQTSKEGQPVVAPIKGVIHCGDVTDNATREQWDQYKQVFGLEGNRGTLQLPVMETFGNHDGDTSGTVRTGIRERNEKRQGLSRVSANGLHYSWNWQGHHFVVLGSYPGDGWDPNCEWCHYFEESFKYPQNSLSFLKRDLKEEAKGKNRPVFLFFHYGWDDFSKLWWTQSERDKFHEAIQDHPVKAIFHGHNHVPNHYKWRGIDVFAVGSPQTNKGTGNYLVVQVDEENFTVTNRKYNHWADTLYHK